LPMVPHFLPGPCSCTDWSHMKSVHLWLWKSTFSVCEILKECVPMRVWMWLCVLVCLLRENEFILKLHFSLDFDQFIPLCQCFSASAKLTMGQVTRCCWYCLVIVGCFHLLLVYKN
jgi:hypothetical protein